MYIERLFITASNWKLPKCPAKIEKKNKLYIFTQWNTILPWRIKISNCSQQYENLTNVILSKRNRHTEYR